MHYPTTLAGLLAAATLASAAAVPTRMTIPTNGINNNDGTFSVRQVRNPKHRGNRHGTLARERAYLKYNVDMPTELTRAVSRIRNSIRLSAWRRETGSAVATPSTYDVEYLTPVHIGNPPQELNLDFDTGSSDLWVYSSSTPSSDVNGQTVYDPNSSSTAKRASGLSWNIAYGDGSTSKGVVYYDTVSVGGLAVKNQAVEAATNVSSEFTADSDLDGLLGLGFTSINTVTPIAQHTFFNTSRGQLDSFLFTADLKAGHPGTYNFGFIDNTAYTGRISYTPVDNSQGFWGFTTTGYKIGDGSFQLAQVKAIADTGTTLLLLEDAIVSAYYRQVPGAAYAPTTGGYTFPCNATLPDFMFGVGDGTITVPGAYVNYAPVDKDHCYGGIQSNSGMGFSIFGDVALKAAFVVFDGENTRLGWASKTLTVPASKKAKSKAQAQAQSSSS